MTTHKKGAPDERSPRVLTTDAGCAHACGAKTSGTIVTLPPFWGKTNPSRYDTHYRCRSSVAVHVTYTHHRRGESGRWIGGAEHRLRLQGQFQMPDLRAYTTQGEGPSLTSSALGGRGGLPSSRPSNLG